jgi:tetratricopeptide (TPR) repeat protein
MKKETLLQFITVLLIFSLLASAFLVHVRLRKLTENYPDEYRSYYIPSSTQVKAFSLGYQTAAADLLFIWFLQFYDWYNKSVRYSYMEHTFNVMTDLDPQFQDAYIVAALFAFIPLRYDYVYKFLDKGIEKNPGNFVIPYDAGCYAFFSEKNYERASKYFKTAYERNPDKATLKNFFAKALAHKGDLETALSYFEELYAKYKDDNSSEGNYYRVAAARHIWSTKNAIAERDVGKAVGAYKTRFGKNPPSLRSMVAEGLIAAVPKDPMGNDYEYNKEDGKIACKSVFDAKKVIGRW